MPIQLHISNSTVCNMRCTFCPYPSEENMREPRIHMAWHLYEKIVRDGATIPQIDMLTITGLNEPLLDPLLERRIAFAKELRPDWEVDLYTNGTLLAPARFESLKAAGLGRISISVNALNQEQHTKVMGRGGLFQTVVDNTTYARANRGAMKMVVTAVFSNDDFTPADVEAFCATWGLLGVGDGVGAYLFEENWAGQTRLNTSIGKVYDYNSTCDRALGQISVHPDGRVGLCCQDPLVKYQMGDLTKQTIREVYNAPGYIEFREWHRDNQAARHPMCATCTRG